MKVIHINSHYNVGGAGKIVKYLHTEAIKKKIDSIVLYGRGYTVADANVHRISSRLSVLFDGFISRFIGLIGYANRVSTLRAINIIKKEKPDLVHLHVIHGYFLNFKSFFKFINKANIPVVWTFHDCWAFTGKCGYFYDCNKFVSGCSKCPLKKDYPKVFGFDFSKKMWKDKRKLFTKNNPIVVTPSNWLTTIAKSSFFSKCECLTINNGIETNDNFNYCDKKICRKMLGLNVDSKIALGVAFGQNNPRKGFKYILNAARALPHITFVVIGWNAKDSLPSDINNIKTFPFVSNQEELSLFFKSADVFLLPSLEENYATTALEAICCGTPVVGFNSGGTPEIVNGIYGQVVRVADDLSFQKAIIHQINHNNKNRKERSKNAINDHSAIKMANSYFNLYSKIISAKEMKD